MLRFVLQENPFYNHFHQSLLVSSFAHALPFTSMMHMCWHAYMRQLIVFL